MKANVEIEGKTITINLTQDQINEITKQSCRLQKAEDIQDYRDACEVLGKAPKSRENFDEEWEWITHQLYTQIEAGNFLDNDRKKYMPDFTDGSTSKYIPYFERKGSGWVLRAVNGCLRRSHCPVALYYKSNKTAKLFAERFNGLYNKYLG